MQAFYNALVDSYSSQKFSLTPRILRWLTARRPRRSLFAGDAEYRQPAERAGNTNVIHMHGELLKVRFRKVVRFSTGPETLRQKINALLPVPGTLAPARRLVWRNATGMDEIYMALSMADIFIAIGIPGMFIRQLGLFTKRNCMAHHRGTES